MKDVSHLGMGPHWQCRDCGKKHNKYGFVFKIKPNDNNLNYNPCLK